MHGTHHRARPLLLIHGVGGGALMAASLLLLPPNFTTGPSLTVVYQIADRHTWGWLWAAIAIVCFTARNRPRLAESAIAFLGGCTAAWAVALFWPLLTAGETNALAFIPWLTISAACLFVGVAHGRR